MTFDSRSEDDLGLVGTELDGRYRIDRYLGSGTMGSVYEATQLAVGRRVAVKILNQALKTNAEVRERFRVEAQAIASLNHPNCITLFDFGYSDRFGALYMVVEYLDGHTLEQRLALDLPKEEALAIGYQIADVLAQAHEAGILHRDLKPENVMLIPGSAAGPVVKVLDFGLARIFDSGNHRSARLTRQGQLFGTPAYMSPEQCAGSVNVGPAADVYALGISLYEMLGGFLPFVSENVAELLIKHATAEPPPLECDADPDIVELVMRMLAKDPGERPTASEIAERLRRYASLGGRAPAQPRRSAVPVEVIAPKARRAPGETGEYAVAKPTVQASADTVAPDSVDGEPGEQAGVVPIHGESSTESDAEDDEKAVVRPGPLDTMQGLDDVESTSEEPRPVPYGLIAVGVIALLVGLIFVVTSNGAPDDATATPASTNVTTSAADDPQSAVTEVAPAAVEAPAMVTEEVAEFDATSSAEERARLLRQRAANHASAADTALRQTEEEAARAEAEAVAAAEAKAAAGTKRRRNQRAQQKKNNKSIKTRTEPAEEPSKTDPDSPKEIRKLKFRY